MAYPAWEPETFWYRPAPARPAASFTVYSGFAPMPDRAAFPGRLGSRLPALAAVLMVLSKLCPFFSWTFSPVRERKSAREVSPAP